MHNELKKLMAGGASYNDLRAMLDEMEEADKIAEAEAESKREAELTVARYAIAEAYDNYAQLMGFMGGVEDTPREERMKLIVEALKESEEEMRSMEKLLCSLFKSKPTVKTMKSPEKTATKEHQLDADVILANFLRGLK